ncbi:unnamed protein product [Amoebophrya sp. A120]|nr:unnamed protein product [Amoebophrya sp. A120]|eukprot:GSA120T00023643001.1
MKLLLHAAEIKTRQTCSQLSTSWDQKTTAPPLRNGQGT